VTVTYDAASWSTPYTGVVPPGMLRIHEHVEEFDPAGIDAGVCSNRPVRGGSAPSVHRDCRAKDHRFSSYGALDELKWLYVDHAELLQVQRFTDYGRGLTWDCRLPGSGWGIFAGAGSKYAPGPTLERNVHIERNWQGARDPRSVEEILGATAPPEQDVPPEEEDEEMWYWIKPTNAQGLYLSDGASRYVHIPNDPDQIAWLDIIHQAGRPNDQPGSRSSFPLKVPKRYLQRMQLVGARNQATVKPVDDLDAIWKPT
jgi:hypothetical protein